MPVVPGVDQLSDDPDPVAFPSDAALQDETHAELATDVLEDLGGVLVGHDRRPGDDFEIPDAGELGDDIFRDPVAEVLVLPAVAEILEGENGDRLVVGDNPRRSREDRDLYDGRAGDGGQDKIKGRFALVDPLPSRGPVPPGENEARGKAAHEDGENAVEEPKG